MARVEILNGIERRRRWSEADKRRIVGETLAPEAVIADVARRNGAAASLVFAWRREARENGALTPIQAPERVSTVESKLEHPAHAGAASPAFIPVTIAPDLSERGATSSKPAISISFGANISVKLEGAPDAGTLAHVINVLSASVVRG